MDGTGGGTQLAEGLPSKRESLGSITHKPGVEVHICNLSTQEMEAEGSASQCHSQLYSNSNRSLVGYITYLSHLPVCGEGCKLSGTASACVMPACLLSCSLPLRTQTLLLWNWSPKLNDFFKLSWSWQ